MRDVGEVRKTILIIADELESVKTIKDVIEWENLQYKVIYDDESYVLIPRSFIEDCIDSNGRDGKRQIIEILLKSVLDAGWK